MSVLDDILMKWHDSHGGVGYYPAVPEDTYGQAYWEEYVRRAGTTMGRALTQARLNLVFEYTGGPVVDIGIGCGQFIESRGWQDKRTYGYDVNPVAIRWLVDRGLWWDPYFKSPAVVTCWDSLEHMPRPDRFVERVLDLVFVSLPIFENKAHALASKHFKPKEHYYYFTDGGLKSYMQGLDFECLNQNQMETDLGREGIGTYVFKRVSK